MIITSSLMSLTVEVELRRMSERVYNLFAYTDEKTISHLGIKEYDVEGTDTSKVTFLRERALLDHVTALKVQISKPVVTCEHYSAKMRLDTHLDLFEELFVRLKAPDNPLFVMTMIVNGKPKIDRTYNGPLVLDEIEGRAKMVDYLVHYKNGSVFDLPQMFEDDYFKAIKLLFNNGHFVSSTKLLLIFIDTIAYVEYGDVRNNFIQWLNTYVNLATLDLSPEELWELRNGIIHTSSPSSRKVQEKKVKQLVPCVNLAAAQAQVQVEPNEKLFDLLALIKAIAMGLETWLRTYNEEPGKFERFVERYDTVISDARGAHLSKQSKVLIMDLV